MELSPLEIAVLERPAGDGVRLTPSEMESLLADPGFVPSLGQPGHARHFRKSLPGGGGLHLVVGPEGADLHRDRFDPGGGPLSLLLHLATDSPEEALGTLAAGWSVLGRLGRKSPPPGGR